ncbi:MAG: hypothetical protein FJZ96_07810 [Chloroflexi bacterium]|nr:hypothetical protein [Chloroflexota bacterium]
MIPYRSRPETILFLLAFVLALLLRLGGLGVAPLSDYEAGWALQSLAVAGGEDPALDPNPAYIFLTAVGFFIFDATNFLARIWPALAGSLLVLAPFFLRRELGPIPAAILSLGLAIDPGLLALSRLAGSPLPALVCALWAWIAWRAARPGWAGACAALALLSGPFLWSGLLGLGIAWLAVTLLPGRRPASGDAAGRCLTPPAWERLKPALGWGLGALLAGGSLFLVAPHGLSALAASIPAFLEGWWTPSGIPLRHLLIALPAYAPLALVFGIAGLVRGWVKGDRLAIGLGLWFLSALLLALLYPGRQVWHLAWALLPLWALAAQEISRCLDPQGLSAWELAGVNLLTLAMLGFSWLDFAGLPGLIFSDPVGQTRLMLLAGALLLLGLSLLLIALGWSEKLARIGLAWGGGLALIVFTIGAATGAAGFRPQETDELWAVNPQVTQADLLLGTVQDLSEWTLGADRSLAVTIYDIDSAALLWLFRAWEVESTQALDPTQAPALVIAPQGVDLAQVASYRGQDFSWRRVVNWDQAIPGDWLRWIAFHEMPSQDEWIVLWVREDLLPDGGDPLLQP